METNMPGPSGTLTNCALIDAGTLCRAGSPVPGPTGTIPSAGVHGLHSASEAWKRYQAIHDWWTRIEGYANPEKRDAQIAKDVADLPFKFLEFLGVEIKLVPLVPLWKAELEILV